MGEILMSRLVDAFETKDLLNVYFTAGHPERDSVIELAEILERAGADILEIGMPFSDPIADGPTIQRSSEKALQNGMSIGVLFRQLKQLRKHVKIPVLLMGYINPVLQYGIKRFCEACQDCGIDGLILPDLPMAEYLDEWKPVFEVNGLHNIFLVTPQTSDERIRAIDMVSSGFIYLVSSSSITGAKSGISDEQRHYFERIRHMKLKNKTMIGFGISDKGTFHTACEYADGAIIGSAFINQLEADSSEDAITTFIQSIKN
jgi:tryptophan synthase alpha chain